MPKWLLWFVLAFVALNVLAVIGNFPNPFTLLYEFATKPAPPSRSLDGGIRGLSVVLAVGMLLGWGVVAFVMSKVVK